MSCRNQTAARGEKSIANQDLNEDDDPSIHHLAEEANLAMNVIARLLEQQNRLIADMNCGGKNVVAIVCSDECKVVFASFMLEDEADHWWDATSRILKTFMTIKNHIKWEMFKKAFNEKHFMDRVRFKMQRDFLNLKQGNEFIVEYEEYLIVSICNQTNY
ncbi:hypothetical protein Q3G72_017350 [Acer saccharum]|nr:hypothetical protein Q3G72_017350 [Acer saccharum]